MAAVVKVISLILEHTVRKRFIEYMLLIRDHYSILIMLPLMICALGALSLKLKQNILSIQVNTSPELPSKSLNNIHLLTFKFSHLYLNSNDFCEQSN